MMQVNKLMVCDICDVTNIESIKKNLKDEKNISYTVGCHNMCALGRRKQFAILNGSVIIAETEEELVQKIKLNLK